MNKTFNIDGRKVELNYYIENGAHCVSVESNIDGIVGMIEYNFNTEFFAFDFINDYTEEDARLHIQELIFLKEHQN